MKELELEVVMLPIAELTPYENNPKLHHEEQIEQIIRSIEEFGFNDPIAIDESSGLIITGHGRFEAAKRLEMEVVPVIKLGHLGEADRRAYAIAHNKLSLTTGFDEELLHREFQSLKDMDLDLTLSGFSAGEISDVILRAEGADGLHSLEKEVVDRHRQEYRLPFVFTREERKVVLATVRTAENYFEAITPFEGFKRMCEKFIETITQSSHHTG